MESSISFALILSLPLPLRFSPLGFHLTRGESCQIKSGYSFKQPHFLVSMRAPGVGQCRADSLKASSRIDSATTAENPTLPYILLLLLLLLLYRYLFFSTLSSFSLFSSFLFSTFSTSIFLYYSRYFFCLFSSIKIVGTFVMRLQYPYIFCVYHRIRTYKLRTIPTILSVANESRDRFFLQNRGHCRDCAGARCIYVLYMTINCR